MHWVLDQSDTRSGAPKWRVTGLHVAACGARRAGGRVCIASCSLCVLRRASPATTPSACGSTTHGVPDVLETNRQMALHDAEDAKDPDRER
jgi:hypothetical protein